MYTERMSSESADLDWKRDLTGNMHLDLPLVRLAVEKSSAGLWTWRIEDHGRKEIARAAAPRRSAVQAQIEVLLRVHEGFGRQQSVTARLISRLSGKA